MFIFLEKEKIMNQTYEQVSLSLITAQDLNQLRKKNKWTLRDFSEKVGVSKSLLSAMEKGERIITPKTSDQIKSALGLVLGIKPQEELRAHLDYLKLTLFDSNITIVMEKLLGIESKYFHMQEISRHHYDRIYRCGAIQIYESDKMEQGILLEMSGQGLREFEEHLLENEMELNEWLVQVTTPKIFRENGWYSRYNCTRLDIALDEMLRRTGNYDLRDLLWRYNQKTEVPLVRSPLRSNGNIEGFQYFDEEKELELEKELKLYEPDFFETDETLEKLAQKDWQNDVIQKMQQQENRSQTQSQGLSLKFGSRGSVFYARFYEKARERAKKERATLEEILLDDPVINRYEMELQNQYASYAFEQLALGEPLHQIGISILLSRIEVLEEVPLSSGKIAYQYYKPFYDVFGDYTKVKINGKTNKSKLDDKIRWIENQVIGTLSMVRAVFGREWTQNWLNHLMDEIELSDQQKADIAMEQLRVSNHENGYYERFQKQFIQKKFEMYENAEILGMEQLYRVRLKNNPLKAVLYINSEGGWDTKIPEGMTKLEIQRLGLQTGVDFFDSRLFVVKEVLDG